MALFRFWCQVFKLCLDAELPCAFANVGESETLIDLKVTLRFILKRDVRRQALKPGRPSSVVNMTLFMGWSTYSWNLVVQQGAFQLTKTSSWCIPSS